MRIDMSATSRKRGTITAASSSEIYFTDKKLKLEMHIISGAGVPLGAR